MLHSLDRLNLASELQKELVKKDAYLDVLIQINTAEEETKAGFLPGEIFRAADEIAGLDRLKVTQMSNVRKDKCLLASVQLANLGKKLYRVAVSNNVQRLV